MKKIFENAIECYGCELCAQICPTSVIEMQEDEEGFYYPHIVNLDKCIDCGKCIKVCPNKNRVVKPRPILNFYTGFAKDEVLIRKCASGGLATTISQAIIKEGGVVYGVRYSSDTSEIEYARASTFEELNAFRGSKYAQARKYNIFQQVLSDLKKGTICLFIGLPCDISALYNLTLNKYDNLFTMQLICHGVTSLKVHKEFIRKELEANNELVINDFSVRYKRDAWKPYYIYERFGSDKEVVKLFRPTVYGVAFHYLKRPSCNSCRFKIYDESYGMQADITIGDNHGVAKDDVSYHHWGSSVIISHSEKGEDLLVKIRGTFNIYEDNDRIISSNLALYRPFPEKTNRKQFSAVFRERGIYAACKHYTTVYLEWKLRTEQNIKNVLRVFYIPIKKYMTKNKK